MNEIPINLDPTTVISALLKQPDYVVAGFINKLFCRIESKGVTRSNMAPGTARLTANIGSALNLTARITIEAILREETR